MYCKNCGNSIADDSKFCQFCGAIQEDAQMSKERLSQEVTDFIKDSSNKEKLTDALKNELQYHEKNVKKIVLIVLFVLWELMNFLFIFIDMDEDFSYTSTYFYPFDVDTLRYYDFTEFFVYAVILPIAIYGFIMWRRYKQLKKINGK